ncbi:hypothetical protein E3N88_32887 [Mikania micrantha]|uniref:Protein kinase domain-containing protein n=1 Tax=Mikania micrantha TaxID=192012 RepID=A0A5N6MA82_9ASTR|nr:hypothetical protein E3N88_32887 [Mikania micrantha]
MDQKINPMMVKKIAIVIRSWKMRLKMQLQQHVKGLQLPVSGGGRIWVFGGRRRFRGVFDGVPEVKTKTKNAEIHRCFKTNIIHAVVFHIYLNLKNDPQIIHGSASSGTLSMLFSYNYNAAYSVPLSVFSGKQTPNPLLRQWVNHLRTTVRCSNRPSRLSTGQLFLYNSVKGTFGYIDPNYFHSGKLTRKSDVYSFGVVLFEVLTGKQALDPTFDENRPSLAVWAQHHFKERRINDIIDHRMVGQISKKCLKAFASIAVQCLHNQPKLRPTMAEVVVKLDSILLREREHLGSGVDDGRFINKVRYFLKDKADLVSTHAEGSKYDISAEYNQKSNNQNLKTFTNVELVT